MGGEVTRREFIKTVGAEDRKQSACGDVRVLFPGAG